MVIVAPKYLNCATFSKYVLAIFKLNKTVNSFNFLVKIETYCKGKGKKK
jgi:hypothetical protein